jgi:hypothetical protein
VRALPRESRAVLRRRLMVATCLAIVTLVAAIGLIAGLTVNTIAARSSVAPTVTTSPAPAPQGPGITELASHTLLIIAV